MNPRPPGPVEKLKKPRGYQSLVDRVAANVRRLRAARGWTQEEAAHRCELHATLYRMVEGARTNLTASTVVRLCNGFEADAVELFLPTAPAAKRKVGRRTVGTAAAEEGEGAGPESA